MAVTCSCCDWGCCLFPGGPGSRGKVVEVGTFTGGYYRGGVRVKWDNKPDNILGYKVGAEGKVDLVAKSKTSGGTYYPEHLPRLGQCADTQVDSLSWFVLLKNINAWNRVQLCSQLFSMADNCF